MPSTPLLFETVAGREYLSATFQPPVVDYPAILASITKLDVRDTWYRAGWLRFNGFYGATVPVKAVIISVPLGINEPRIIELPSLQGASTVNFGFTPVYWLGEYTISIEGLTP